MKTDSSKPFQREEAREKILYLTKEFILDESEILRFNQLGREISPLYNDLIEKIALKNQNSPWWWMSDLASRNTYSTDLFHQLCLLAYAKLKIESMVSIDKIVVDSKALCQTLQSGDLVQSRKIHVVLRRNWINIFKSLGVGVLACIWGHGRVLRAWLAARWTARNKLLNIQQPVKLISTFVLNSSFSKGDYYDRYFNNFCGYLSSKDRESIYYYPTCVGISNYFKTFSAMRKCSQKFLIKEDFLLLSDLLQACSISYRLLFTKIGKEIFLGFKVDSLLRKTLWTNFLFTRDHEAILKYIAIKRMQEKNVSITTLLSWYENQNIDKALQLAFVHYYPQVNRFGYLCVADHEFCLNIYPTAFEHAHQVLPHRIFITAKGLVSSLSRYLPEANFGLAPAFRYDYLWQASHQFTHTYEQNILVALPITLSDSIAILGMVKDFPWQTFPTVRFQIKCHPSLELERLPRSSQLPASSQVEYVQGDLLIFAKQAQLVISCNSSVCLEVLAFGIPVLIVGSLRELTQNPIPKDVDPLLWKVCFSTQELVLGIKKILQMNEQERAQCRLVSMKVREQYFEAVEMRNTKAFLNYCNLTIHENKE